MARAWQRCRTASTRSLPRFVRRKVILGATNGDQTKVHEYHRKYFEEGEGTRDVLIVAHGHFNRVFISRWVEFSLCLGESHQI